MNGEPTDRELAEGMMMGLGSDELSTTPRVESSPESAYEKFMRELGEIVANPKKGPAYRITVGINLLSETITSDQEDGTTRGNGATYYDELTMEAGRMLELYTNKTTQFKRLLQRAEIRDAQK